LSRSSNIEGQESLLPSDRLFYRIGEVSRITGLKPHVLRYWESEFRVIRPHKAGSLQRLYRKKDLDIIQRIKKLLYEEGFTIAGAKKKIRDLEAPDTLHEEPAPVGRAPKGDDQELLKVVRDELAGIRKMLDTPG
jgi:DNA-binding transcriptional MerR regulator